MRGRLGCGFVFLALGTAPALVVLGDVRVYAPPPSVVLPGVSAVGRPPPPPVIVPAWQITTSGLSAVGVPLAVLGAVIGLLDRRTVWGRVAGLGGLVAVLLNLGALALEYGRGMAGLGAAG